MLVMMVLNARPLLQLMVLGINSLLYGQKNIQSQQKRHHFAFVIVHAAFIEIWHLPIVVQACCTCHKQTNCVGHRGENRYDTEADLTNLMFILFTMSSSSSSFANCPVSNSVITADSATSHTVSIQWKLPQEQVSVLTFFLSNLHTQPHRTPAPFVPPLLFS